MIPAARLALPVCILLPALFPAGCAGERTFGARAGALLPRSGDLREFEANAVLGVSCALGPIDGRAVRYEAGFDAGFREESGYFSSVPLAGRLDALFRLGSGSEAAQWYLLGGASAHVEFVESLSSGDEYTNYAGGIDLGAGLAFAGGTVDLRVTHTVLIGSDNLGGQTMVSVGYFF